MRAGHLELATDLSVDVFIHYPRRFAARRGLPELTILDNAKTFKAADKILSKLFSHPRVKKFLASKRIDWRFNGQSALMGWLFLAIESEYEEMFAEDT